MSNKLDEVGAEGSAPSVLSKLPKFLVTKFLDDFKSVPNIPSREYDRVMNLLDYALIDKKTSIEKIRETNSFTTLISTANLRLGLLCRFLVNHFDKSLVKQARKDWKKFRFSTDVSQENQLMKLHRKLDNARRQKHELKEEIRKLKQKIDHIQAQAPTLRCQ